MPVNSSVWGLACQAFWKRIVAPGSLAACLLGCEPAASLDSDIDGGWIAALEAAPTPAAADRPQRTSPPLRVSVSGPQAPLPSELEVVATVELLSATAVRLALRLPPGVQVLDGQPTEVVDNPPRHLERTFRLRLGAEVPTRALTVVVESMGRGPRATARAHYRFGQGPELLPSPPVREVRLTVQSHPLGQPIPLQ